MPPSRKPQADGDIGSQAQPCRIRQIPWKYNVNPARCPALPSTSTPGPTRTLHTLRRRLLLLVRAVQAWASTASLGPDLTVIP